MKEMTREEISDVVTMMTMIVDTLVMAIIAAFVGDMAVAAFIAVLTLIMSALAYAWVEEH